ncbi:response regulator [bacterium]|nr:response regulator [bacterium]
MAVFLFDLAVPTGIATGALQILALLALSQTQVRWHVPALTGLCTILLGVDALLSSPLASWPVTLANRLISMGALWVAALQIDHQRRQTDQIAKANHESHQLFRQALEAAPDMMLVVTGAGQVRMANQAALIGFSLGSKVPCGIPVVDLLPGYQESVASSEDAEAQRRTGEGRSCDGRCFPVEYRSREFCTDKERLTVLAVRDVGERILLEERMRATQRMEAIGRLAGGIAHDFNNILVVIMSYAKFIESEVPNDNVRVLEDLQEIVIAAERASTLTKQLLAFSRRQVIEPRVIQLGDLLANLTRMLARLVGEDIEITTAVAPDLWPVKVDAGQVEQIILNLTVNARHAMPSSGQLSIELTNVTLDKEYCLEHPEVEPGEYVLLAVTDSGTGMTAEVRARAFDPFFTTKAPGQGSGLGLATVYGIVKQAEGHVWLYSEIGRGTTCKVYLPRTSGTVEPFVTRSAPARARGGSECLLVVEDEAPVRQLLVRVLRQGGYTVLEATNGLDALRLCETCLNDFSLLITDVVMPQMGGRELATRLTGKRPDLRVLFLSGYTENAIVHNGTLDPGLIFLQKPFVAEDLLRRVRELLDT